jgi:two-component system response regulator NreC
MNTIQLMLVDDHDVVRTGLKTFLNTQANLQVVSEASSGQEAIDKVLEARPDVIVMDITMPGMDGLEATARLKELYPQGQVLALTVHEDKQYLFQMLAAGASGYLTKQSVAEELVTAIYAIASGNVYLQPALARWLLEDYRRLLESYPPGEYENALGREGTTGLDVLSKREQEVLELVADGLTSPQIGETLGISPRTVSRHRERIMNKLDLHSSAELVKFAIRTGLVDLQ